MRPDHKGGGAAVKIGKTLIFKCWHYSARRSYKNRKAWKRAVRRESDYVAIRGAFISPARGITRSIVKTITDAVLSGIHLKAAVKKEATI